MQSYNVMCQTRFFYLPSQTEQLAPLVSETAHLTRKASRH
jgi:hypothetical protein